MCDEKKILMLLGELDAKSTILLSQQTNIFDRLGKLEQKNPVCSSHKQIVEDIDNLKSWKNKNIGAISIISVVLGYLVYIFSKLAHILIPK